MKLFTILLAVAFIIGQAQAVNIVSRTEWKAIVPNKTQTMSTPVKYVIIHHSDGESCNTENICKSRVRGIQKFHLTKWDDIGYSFLVGGDGRAYEGRGWKRIGSHTLGYNSKGIGICAIGTFTNTLPPAAQLNTIKELIDEGVSSGWISSNYKLIGHRQSKRTKTECPGDKLYEEIQTWSNYEPNP